MKTTRLVLGIISFVFFFIILFQSCAVGMVNTIGDSSDIGGSAGIFVGVIVIIAGIIAITCRQKAVGSIVAGAFYAFAGLVGIGNSDVYKDLSIWGWLFVIFALFFIISGIRQRRTEKKAIQE